MHEARQERAPHDGAPPRGGFCYRREAREVQVPVAQDVGPIEWQRSGRGLPDWEFVEFATTFQNLVF